MTRLHCTCWAIRASSWSGKSTSGRAQACQSVLYGGDRTLGGCSQYREYVEKPSILSGHGAMRGWHRLPWCLHHWEFYIGCDPAGGVSCQEGPDLQARSLDTHTKNSHHTWDDVGCDNLGNLQVRLLKPVCNARSYPQHRERRTTHSQRWECVWRWEAGVPAEVLCWAPLGVFATAHPADSDKYCGSWSKSAGEQPLWHCVLRASGGSSTIDCKLSYIQATLSCRQQNLRDVFRQIW